MIYTLTQFKKTFYGGRYNPEEFLNYVRKNINDFIKGDDENSLYTFSPSTITNDPEYEIWNNYASPLTAVLHIDIPGNDGSVICSKYNSNEWYFTTLTTPFLDGNDYDGTHPVSGNRAFGIKQNPDGSYTIFTRGVDRGRYRSLEFFAKNVVDQDNMDLLKEFIDIAKKASNIRFQRYKELKDLIDQDPWALIENCAEQNLQNKVQDWVNNHGGQANISTTEAIKVDKEKIKELLESDQTIDQIAGN